jgi:hypothetical protein
MFGAHCVLQTRSVFVIARGQRAEVRGRNHGPPRWEAAAPRSLAYVAGHSHTASLFNTHKQKIGRDLDGNISSAALKTPFCCSQLEIRALFDVSAEFVSKINQQLKSRQVYD